MHSQIQKTPSNKGRDERRLSYRKMWTRGCLLMTNTQKHNHENKYNSTEFAFYFQRSFSTL